MKIVVVSESMAARGIDRLAETVDVVYDRELHADRERLTRLLEDASGLIVHEQTVVDDRLLEHAPNLVVIGRLGAGLANIDVPALEQRGIELRTGAGLHAVSVAEYVMTAASTLVRRAFWHSAEILDGSWPHRACTGGELAGRSIGILGLGTRGRAVAERAKAFGMRTLAFDPLLGDDAPEWNLATSARMEAVLGADVVTLHVPLTDDTYHSIDAATLASMRDGAVLVNTAHGDLVDCNALVTALRDGKLGGAALDVLPEEPPGVELRELLATAPNLVLTPHVAGVTVESIDRISTHIADAVVEVVTK